MQSGFREVRLFGEAIAVVRHRDDEHEQGAPPGRPRRGHCDSRNRAGIVFVHHGLYGGHFGDLVPDRLGVVALQHLVAPPAFGRLAVDDVAELLGRYKRTGLAAMAGLTAPLLARSPSGRTSLDRGGIGGGWLGGVGGVLVEPLLQVGDPPLEGLHQHRHRRLHLGWEFIPDGSWQRWLISHADVLLSSRPGSNNGP